MSNKNNQKMKSGAFFKYGLIAALLLLAPVALVNQIVVPMLSA